MKSPLAVKGLIRDSFLNNLGRLPYHVTGSCKGPISYVVKNDSNQEKMYAD